MKLNLKYTAVKVDEIEQAKKLPIENCIADTTIGNLILFIQKGLVNDSNGASISKTNAITVIDEYLAEHDKDELVMDIMEALMNGGFLSRELDLEKVRELKAKRKEQLDEELNNL